MISRPVRIAVLLTTFAAACLIAGCAGQPEEESTPTLPPYPAELSAASTPSQVATVLIQALDAGDKQTLPGLVAAKHEVDQVDGIYRQYGKSHETPPETAAGMAVAGWVMSYEWFEKGATRVTGEDVSGDTAAVQAQGRNPHTGRARLLTIEVVREDGVWKVTGGLQSQEL
jgi:hypothetical protein